MLKPIEEHVLSQAREEAAATVAQARGEAEASLAAAKAEANASLASEIARLASGLDAGLDREVSTRRAAHGQTILRDKSRVLDAAFDAAAEKLVAHKGYWDLLRRRLRELAGRPGRVLCRAEHRETIGKLIAELDRETGGKMPKLADEAEDIRGGFILHGEHYDVDCSLETELAAFREKALSELATKAFGA